MRANRRTLSFIMALAVIFLTGLSATWPARGDNEAEETLVVGFTAAHFTDINRADAVAAIKVWIETVINTRGLKLGAKTIVYDDVDSLTAALKTGTPDLMILLTPEYTSIQSHNLLDPQYVSVRGQKIGEIYLLAVNQKGGLQSLPDLSGRKLIVKQGARMSLAECWLDRILAAEQLPESNVLFESVKREENVSRTVLPVFFGKADACLVTLNGFEMMSELNPQIRRHLIPLVNSPCLVPSITCLRSGYESVFRSEVVEALGELHTEPKGQQILSLFGVDRLVPFEPEHLVTVYELLQETGDVPASGVIP